MFGLGTLISLAVATSIDVGNGADLRAFSKFHPDRCYHNRTNKFFAHNNRILYRSSIWEKIQAKRQCCRWCDFDRNRLKDTDRTSGRRLTTVA